jgi:hypothetical protein
MVVVWGTITLELPNRKRAASALSHPNIGTIYDIREAGETRFIADESCCLFIALSPNRQPLDNDGFSKPWVEPCSLSGPMKRHEGVYLLDGIDQKLGDKVA